MSPQRDLQVIVGVGEAQAAGVGWLVGWKGEVWKGEDEHLMVFGVWFYQCTTISVY